MFWARAVSLPGGYQHFDAEAYYPNLVTRLSELPNVQSVGLSRLYPAYMSFNQSILLQPVGRAASSDFSQDVSAIVTEAVSPGFFKTVGISVLEGRDFTWHDNSKNVPVAIISASLKQRLFPDGPAMGERLRLRNNSTLGEIEIVGTVTDASIGNLRDSQVPVVFRPLLQDVARIPIISIRTVVAEDNIRQRVQNTVVSLGREYIRTVYSLDEQVKRSLIQERVTAGLSTFFGVSAVMMTSIGLYGALAYTVTRRRREIGVMMALGAARSDVLKAIVVESLTVTALGVILGVPMALVAVRFVASMLFGVTPSDPVVIVAAPALLLFVATVAALRPAIAASRIDPVQSLRVE